MTTSIEEYISVQLFTNHVKRSVRPWLFFWRDRRYQISTIGLHHTVRRGSILYHLFTVSDSSSTYKLELNTQTLTWKLLELSDDI